MRPHRPGQSLHARCVGQLSCVAPGAGLVGRRVV